MGDITGSANKLQTTRTNPSLTKQAWQPIPSNAKDYVVSAANMGITVLTTYGCREQTFVSGGGPGVRTVTPSREQQVRSNLLLLWKERTLHEGLPGQEESQNDQDVIKDV